MTSSAAATLPWRARLARRAAVTVGDTSRRLHLGSGSVIGGRVAMLIDGGVLSELTRGRDVALVSGTNGKTTTTSLLACALRVRREVASSRAGSNLPAGLAAALASSAAGAAAVLEVDEGYLGTIVQSTRPVTVTLLNLSRDELDRVSEVRMVANRWRHALEVGGAAVIANADDPLVVWAAAGAAHTVWVAAGALWRSDAVGCPACDGAISFGDDGVDWWCSCGFRRPEPDVRLDDGDFVAGDRRLPVKLLLPGRFNQANAVMAAATAEVHGVDAEDALAAMAGVGDVEGRFAVVTAGAVTTRLLLAKNPAGWTELLGMLDLGQEPVVIGINARIADGHDPSWLWDVPFERLAGRAVVATGERCRDLAVRLRYAGVAHMTVEDQMEALAAAGASHLEYVGNYTAFQELRRRVARADALSVAVSAVPAPQIALPSDTSDEVTTRTRPRRPTSSASTLRVVVVHPDLLGTYGDGGNGEILFRRAQWRGIATEILLAHSDRPLPTSADVYCIGGGEDGPQVQSARLLASGSLATAVSGGAAVLAVCAGYQIVGRVFAGPDGGPHEGVGLLDVSTVKGAGPRAVGELVADVVAVTATAGRETLTGFENHSGVTRLGPDAAPLAVVRTGVGNGDGAGTEGACSGSVIGTYLHGPVLARNPWLADRLLALATGGDLEPLDDTEEEALRAERLSAASVPSWHRHLTPMRRHRQTPARRP